MNKLKLILILTFLGFVFLSAFEDVFSRSTDFNTVIGDVQNAYYMTGNPAGIIYKGNIEVIDFLGSFNKNNFKRAYDPSSSNILNISYFTLRKLADNSFFAAGISYDDQRYRDMYGSREKDFYDDYFSTIDSSGGNTGYYGPRLNIMYNLEITENLFLGFSGNYGVERGLKDTFPETITIMRNSSYNVGLDYRKPAFGIGLHGRYYDDQTYYESVKSYSEVIPKTYMGYNVYFNEVSSSTSKKKRNRNGLEYGGNIRLNKSDKLVFNTNISGLYRLSRSEMYTSYSKPRGLWERKGINILTDLTFHANETFHTRIYGEYLHFTDWGSSLISNVLILENEETYAHAGGLLVYQPSMTQKAMAGGEVGKVSYDYIEYVFPFSDTRNGIEWRFFGGAEFFLSSKTKLNFNLEYGKEVPKFYWNTDYFQNTALTISLEQLFSFGYIEIMFENIKKIPANDSQSISLIQFGLSYRTK